MGKLRISQERLSKFLVYFIGGTLVGIGVLMAVSSSKSDGESSISFEKREELKADAEARVRSEWIFSDYANERMPEEMAGGGWSATENIWNCNLEQFFCVGVEFKLPDSKAKAEWVLSYDKHTGKYFATRTLSDATTALFRQSPSMAENVTHPTQALDRSGASVDEERIAPAQGEMIKFIRLHYEMGPELLALYSNSPPTSGMWYEVPSSDHQKKEICLQNEANCYTVYFSDVPNRVVCYWIVAILRADRQEQHIYPSDEARRLFNKNPSPLEEPIVMK